MCNGKLYLWIHSPKKDNGWEIFISKKETEKLARGLAKFSREGKYDKAVEGYFMPEAK